MLEGLADNDLRGASSNALVAHPAGILDGVDHHVTGRVERVDTQLLKPSLDRDIVPVIPPVGCDGEGHTYRLNSDAVAVEVARALEAVKLIYLCRRHRPPRMGGKVLPARHASKKPEISSRSIAPSHAVRCSRNWNTARGRHGGRAARPHHRWPTEEGLLAEVFSNEGVGTLIHANEYQAIRKAHKKDVRAVFNLIQRGIENDELLKRTRAEIERQIDDFFVFEVDRIRSPCGAARLPRREESRVGLRLCRSRHENQGIGAKLIHYAEDHGRALGLAELFCLSTQAINYFVQKGGFRLERPTICRRRGSGTRRAAVIRRCC